MKTSYSSGFKTTLMVSAVLSCCATASAVAGGAVVGSPGAGAAAASAIDYGAAKPMALPQALSEPSSQLDSLLEAQAAGAAAGPSGASQGAKGSGKLSPVTLQSPTPGVIDNSPDAIAPQEYGTANQVYTTSQTNAFGDLTTRYYPFRAAGRLWFKIGTGSYVCSASLIKPGVIVTAAHCVANYGKKQWYTAWQFAPGYDKGVAPYGVAGYKTAYVMSSYFNGTDSCYQAGVICQNDVAVVVLNTNLGATAGWYGYGYGGYNYVNNQALITQLGYPVALDGGTWQERTDSQGFVSSVMSGNTIIGSLQTGGSSGGPWVTNLGMAPVLSGIGFGSGAGHNVVVGVTSWGYVSGAVKQQGASPFTSGNIQALITAACAAYPTSC